MNATALQVRRPNLCGKSRDHNGEAPALEHLYNDRFRLRKGTTTMRRSRNLRYLSAVSGLGVLLVSSSLAQSSFQALGPLSEGEPWRFARLSRNGQAVAGALDANGTATPYRYTEMDGIVPVGDLPGGGTSGIAWGISQTGKFVVGQSSTAAGSEAFLWSAAGGMINLGDLPGNVTNGFASAVSQDGAVVVGTADAVYTWPIITGQAFRWTQANGMVGLGYLYPGQVYSEANAISASGDVIVGSSRGPQGGGLPQEAIRWTQATGMVGLGTLPNPVDHYSVAYGITRSGDAIVGLSGANDGYQAFVWRESTGMVGLGLGPSGNYSTAYGISADGATIVGMYNWDGYHSQAAIWDATNGLRDFTAMLHSDYGLDVGNWTLEYCSGISDDGRVIVGDGIDPNGVWRTWLVTLDKPTCAADLDFDGSVGLTDLAALLSVFGSICP